MLGASYKTKKALKDKVLEDPNHMLRYVETSFFGVEYRPTGTFCVVGPCAHTNRKWYAQVTMAENRIIKVK